MVDNSAGSMISSATHCQKWGHFTPVINCQRHLIFKMADKNYRSQGKRVPYDILDNLSSVDVFCQEKIFKKKKKLSTRASG